MANVVNNLWFFVWILIFSRKLSSVLGLVCNKALNEMRLGSRIAFEWVDVLDEKRRRLVVPELSDWKQTSMGMSWVIPMMATMATKPVVGRMKLWDNKFMAFIKQSMRSTEYVSKRAVEHSMSEGRECGRSGSQLCVGIPSAVPRSDSIGLSRSDTRHALCNVGHHLLLLPRMQFYCANTRPETRDQRRHFPLHCIALHSLCLHWTAKDCSPAVL